MPADKTKDDLVKDDAEFPVVQDKAAEPAATEPAVADRAPGTQAAHDGWDRLKSVAPISRPTIPAGIPGTVEAAPTPTEKATEIDVIRARHVANSGMSAEHIAIVDRMVDEIKHAVA